MANRHQKEDKDDREIIEGKTFALLSYLSILCIIPLILKKDNKFCLFHARQGLVIFIGEIAITFIGIIPILGWFIFSLFSLVLGILSLVGIVQALMGNYWKIPVVGDIAEKIKF